MPFNCWNPKKIFKKFSWQESFAFSSSEPEISIQLLCKMFTYKFPQQKLFKLRELDLFTMFEKKCPKCDNKIKKNFIYCPFCSVDLKSMYEQEDYGFLGKSDLIGENFNLTDEFIDKMFNSAMKLFEKQIKNFHNELNNGYNKAPGLNIQFFVNGEKIIPDKRNQISVKQSNIELSKDKLKKFAELPKKEPISRLKRLSGRIIYELHVPGVKTINDVLINKLENSIEIKALAKDNVYSKNLKVNLPILKYSLVNDNLIIEMQAK